ncbi:hypothetical protein HHK36_022853 [Tetracentron sinense]|uniref:Uncharacterized protein n=1 Tax=Tetracentron sinense TaxID=13715 RepID=A0A834YQR4_TETSI|nr:hypothetical protein HHK36_022853 [Tetracentron sinense]
MGGTSSSESSKSTTQTVSSSTLTGVDSYTGSDGVTHYGVVTLKGLWTLSDSGSEDLSGYKLCKTDFVHAFLAVTVFMVVVLMEPNTVKCFYPSFESTQTTLLKVLPPIVGVLSSSVFVSVPCKHSYPGSDGVTHYGVVTLEGLWTLSDSGRRTYRVPSSKNRLVHAFLAVTVFMVLFSWNPTQ